MLVSTSRQPSSVRRRHGKATRCVPLLSITASSRSRSNGAVSIGFHSIMDDRSSIKPTDVCDLNHWRCVLLVNKPMSPANPYRWRQQIANTSIAILTFLPLRQRRRPQNRIALSSLLWRIRNFAALSRCGSQSAKFVKYDSLVGPGISLPTPNRCRTGKNGNCMGDEGKAVGSAQAPAALL